MLDLIMKSAIENTLIWHVTDKKITVLVGLILRQYRCHFYFFVENFHKNKDLKCIEQSTFSMCVFFLSFDFSTCKITSQKQSPV